MRAGAKSPWLEWWDEWIHTHQVCGDAPLEWLEEVMRQAWQAGYRAGEDDWRDPIA
jgi:hypothetical protein